MILGALLAGAILDSGFFIVLVGLAIAIVMVARVGSFVRAHLPGMQLEIGQVNQAVNHVSPGEPKLIDQVRAIGSKQVEMDEKFEVQLVDVAENFKRLDQKLTNHMTDENVLIGIVMDHMEVLHNVVAESFKPWDGVERRTPLESWDGVEKRIADASAAIPSPS